MIVRDRFQKIYDDTCFYSTLDNVFEHPEYVYLQQNLIYIIPQVVDCLDDFPLIAMGLLHELEPPKVAEEDYGKVMLIKDKWKKWAINLGYDENRFEFDRLQKEYEENLGNCADEEVVLFLEEMQSILDDEDDFLKLGDVSLELFFEKEESDEQED